MQRSLGAGPGRIDGRRAVDDVVVDPVLGIRRPFAAPQAMHVALVVAEQRLGVAVSRKHDPAQVVVIGHQRAIRFADLRLGRAGVPRPPVAEPQRRKHVDARALGSRVADRHADAEIVGHRLGVVDGDVPIARVGECTGVQQLVLADCATALGVLGNQVGVGKLRLRIRVAPAHPRVRRRRVQVPPVLLDVLAVVALVTREAEGTLLQDRVAAVPKCERQAQQLILVADAAEPVLAPAVSPRAGLIVRERGPRVAVGAVVLADGAPGALAQIRAPPPPRRIIAAVALGRAGRCARARNVCAWPRGTHAVNLRRVGVPPRSRIGNADVQARCSRGGRPYTGPCTR